MSNVPSTLMRTPEKEIDRGQFTSQSQPVESEIQLKLIKMNNDLDQGFKSNPREKSKSPKKVPQQVEPIENDKYLKSNNS